MAVKKKTEELVEESVEVEEIEEVKEVEEEEVYTPESEEKQAFRGLIEKYKEQNPIKYAEKAERLLAKLKAMK